MDLFKKMVLLKDNKTYKFVDKTSEISWITYQNNHLVSVTFSDNHKTYNYKAVNIRFLENPKKINAEDVIVSIDNFPREDYSTILDFGEYIRIFDKNNRPTSYHKSRVSYQNSILNAQKPKAIFNYFKDLSKYVSVTDDGKTILFKLYEKITKINENSVLATYLSGKSIKAERFNHIPIFPFGINLSQKKAVKTALENSTSIIEGPPGTGKTQTILNIIANVVSQGQTVGVVAGNNSATLNVQEKLEKNGYGFITAFLGNRENQKDFFNSKQQEIPDITEWGKEPEERNTLSEELQKTSENLEKLLADKNKIANLQEEVAKLKVEQTYFEKYFKGTYIPIKQYSFYKKWSYDSILEFMTHYERFVLKINKLTAKTYLLFKYGIYRQKQIIEHQNDIISSLKKDYYHRGMEEREKEITSLKAKLEKKSYEDLMEQYSEVSAALFKASLHEKYTKRSRESYNIHDYKRNFRDFIDDYPVILSTTHSILNSISVNYLFDYLIIDEASQVDLVTASLALSCSRNVVIVGDVKQLPQIVPTNIKQKSDELFYNLNKKEAYNYSKYSIIASYIEIYKEDLPKTLLSEHYRCHPKIIGFCNEKFYDNQLVVMTEEKPEDKPLILYKTAPGNHAREDKIINKKSLYNIRQIEVIRDEILATYHDNDINNVGIISPYRRHVTETKKLIQHSELEVDTIHKYQGREKGTIIFTTVANKMTLFINDANLINVAVSRAINELILVTSDKLFKQHGTYIGDLIRYMEYNSLSSDIRESQKISVFDLLYSEYSSKLLKIMNSNMHVSEYKSENLMYSIIEEVLAFPKFNSFKCVIHVPLHSIIKDFHNLNEEEKRYAENPWTHVDFLIYNKLDKEPVLAVEVDGVEYHQNNEQQFKRDQLKNRILEQNKLSLLRISTNESGEKEKLVQVLDEIVRSSGEIE